MLKLLIGSLSLELGLDEGQRRRATRHASPQNLKRRRAEAQAGSKLPGDGAPERRGLVGCAADDEACGRLWATVGSADQQHFGGRTRGGMLAFRGGRLDGVEFRELVLCPVASFRSTSFLNSGSSRIGSKSESPAV